MNKKFFKTEKFKHGTMATAFTAVFVVLVIVLNVITSALADRFPSMNIDLTSQGLNSLSDKAMDVARNAEYKTTIYLLGTEDNYKDDLIYANYNLRYSQVANLAEKMQEANPEMVNVEYIDPDLNPQFISNYPDETLSTGMVVVQTEKRYKVLTVTDMFNIEQDSTTGAYVYYSMVDGALANAVHLANLMNVPVVAFASGHSELLTASLRTSMEALFKENSFEVVEFNIMTEAIPENAAVLFIPAPTTDYTKEEVDKVRSYLEDETKTYSHSVIVTGDPNQTSMPNLYALLEEWGIGVESGIILDSDESNVLSSSTGPAFNCYFTNNVNEVFAENGYSAMITINSRPIEILFNTVINGIEVTPLLQTNDTAYISQSTEASENPDTGVLTSAAMAERAYTAPDKNMYASYLCVFGDTTVFADTYFSSTAFGNRAFTLGLVQHTTGTEDQTLGITINPTATASYDIVMSASVANFVGFIIFTVIIPLAILALGLVVFLKRRHL